MTDTTMNTGAASLSDEQRGAIRWALAHVERHGYEAGSVYDGYAKAFKALLAARTPQADAAPIINGHAINDLFLKWSEWTTELGEAISRKNIDGFVSELRAAIAAGGAQEAMQMLLSKVPIPPNAITFDKGWELLDELQRVALLAASNGEKKNV